MVVIDNESNSYWDNLDISKNDIYYRYNVD